MKAFVILCLVAFGCFAEPVIFYSKTFPGSVPAFVSVELKKDGSAVYQEAPVDENAVKFTLPPATVTEIFDLTEKLDRFQRPVESNLKVANMGAKLFRFTDGAEKHEVVFNYSLDESAKALSDCFERIVETQRIFFDLERTVRFDKLGVNKSILMVQGAIERNRLVGPERFLPMLDRVAKNDSYLNMARERAVALADSIRTPKQKAAE